MTGVASDPRAHASPLRVIFVGLALLGVLGASLALFLVRPQSFALDGAALMEELFGGTPASWGTMDGPDALLLPTGEKVITFRGVGEDIEEITLMIVPRERATDVLREQFQELKFDSDRKGGDRGGRGRGGRSGWGDGDGDGEDEKKERPKLQDLSTFDWHGFDAVHARVRHGGGSPTDDEPFHEVSRVNLSSGEECVIAYLRYRDRAIGSLPQAKALIDAL